MTTIAATWSPNGACLAADSGITDGSFATLPPMKKIVQQGTWLIAAAGEDRICDILQYTIKYPVVPPALIKRDDEHWYKWLSTRVVKVIVEAAQKHLSLDIEHGVAELPDSEFILATHGRIFGISNSLGISKLKPYWAIGSGGSIALGALNYQHRHNKNWNMAYSVIAEQAVMSAVAHDSFTHMPIDSYISTPSGKITKKHVS